MGELFELEPVEIKKRNLQRLYELEPSYVAGEVTKEEVKDKTFIAVVAPYRSGKTVVTDAVVAMEPRIQLINTSTTRARKPAEDQPNFKTATEGITCEWFLQKVNEGALANYSVIPDVDAYGTLAEDFPGNYSIGPFLPSGLVQIRKAGFKRLHAVYILTPKELWREFVNESRDELGDEKFKKRALESIDSANYALNNIDDFIFLENSVKGPEGIQKLAHTICDIALNNNLKHGLSKHKATQYLQGIKTVAEELALH